MEPLAGGTHRSGSVSVGSAVGSSIARALALMNEATRMLEVAKMLEHNESALAAAVPGGPTTTVRGPTTGKC
eukprot:COSAG03_NODE_22481_length_290_cov_1.089005_1_plen_71_part_01